MLIDASSATLLGDAVRVAGSVSGSSPGAGLGLFIVVMLVFQLVLFGVVGVGTGCIAAGLLSGVALSQAAAAGVGVGVAATIANGVLIVYINDFTDWGINPLRWSIFVGPMSVAIITVASVLLLKWSAAAVARN